MIQQTSIEAYDALARNKSLGDKQKIVLACLMDRGPLNNRMIGYILRWPVNCVTGRIKELREMGFVVEHHRARDYSTNKTTIYWEALQ